MKILVKIGYIITSVIFVFYLAIPNLSFPEPPVDALQSNEPGDIESPSRRAYFTDLTREEVILHYKRQLGTGFFLNPILPAYRLNYPPEEAQVIIRDQTRSTFLEEINHPFRGSLFINGFEPKDPKDAVVIQGKVWRQKIIVKQVQSNLVVREVLGLVVIILFPLVFMSFVMTFRQFRKEIKRVWIYR